MAFLLVKSDGLFGLFFVKKCIAIFYWYNICMCFIQDIYDRKVLLCRGS